MSCLDAAAVQGYVEGALGEDERARVEAHLDGCDDCRRLVAALAGTSNTAVESPATAQASPASLRRRSAPKHVEAIDRYQLQRYLGAGGMGVVYAAHDPELRRDVAVKLLHPESAATGVDLQARLLREAQAMAQVAHPNVIAVYDVGTWNGEVFLAMELATGGTLRAWCKRERQKPRAIVEAYIAAGRGLAAAHAVGLVHRDFKPDNVLVGGDGRMRVTDFGLARSHGAPSEVTAGRSSKPLDSLTMTGAVMGTPGYMAPELYNGDPADARTDQFAFCVALWEALFGERPFAGASEIELAEAVMSERIRTPRDRKGVSRALERALRRGLAADPAQRWPTMDALLDALAPRTRRTGLYVAGASLAMAGLAAAAITRPWVAAAPAPVVVKAPADAAVDAMDPELASALSDTQSEIGRVNAARSRGFFVQAQQTVEALVATARQGKSTLPLIDALIARADLLGDIADFAGVERDLREARRLAETAGDDRRKTFASLKLGMVLVTEGKLDEARDLRAMSSATAARPTADDATRAAAFEAEATWSFDDVDKAVKRFDEALVLRDKLGDLPGRTANRIALAQGLETAQRLEQARDVLLAALDVIARRSEQEPLSAPQQRMPVLSLLAFIENELGHFTAAEKYAREEIALAESLLGTSAWSLAEAYAVLGGALLGRGDTTGAAAAFDRVLVLAIDVPLRRIQLEQLIAKSYYQRRFYREAITHIEAGVALASKLTGADSPLTQQETVDLAWLLLATHQIARARALAEHALVVLEAAKMTPLIVGNARFALARALPAADHARAVTLARRAREDYVAAGPAGAKNLDRVDRWLADPGAAIDP